MESGGLSNFFANTNKPVSIKDIILKFKLNDSDYENLQEELFQLEKNGEIIKDKMGNFMHVPDDFYLKHGVIRISKKEHYYIELGYGERVMIRPENLNGAHRGSVVFVEILQNDEFHKKSFEGIVRRVVKRDTLLEEKGFLCKGKIQISGRGRTYIHFRGKIINILADDLNGAYLSDEVTVYAVRKKSDYFGAVKGIIKRNYKQHVFELKKEHGELIWKTKDQNLTATLIDNHMKFFEGDKILANVIDKDGKCFIEYVEKLSSKTLGNLDVMSLAYDRGFSCQFSNKVKKEVKNISKEISQEEIDRRLDLRMIPTVTIDSSSAKDLDDAISLIKKENGNYLLFVSIADVSHYIKPGMALFEEAMKRGTSVYLGDTVIPMLPFEISNGICSLNEGEDKLAYTCKMEINSEGNIIDYDIIETIIRSDCKMEYEKVNQYLLDKEKESEYYPYDELIQNMDKLSSILEKKKELRGSPMFPENEHQVELDIDGNPVAIKVNQHGKAGKIIENFMLAANETVATHAFWLSLPFIYRNHDYPNGIKLQKLAQNLYECGHRINRIRNAKDPIIFQKLLSSFSNEKDFLYIANMILQSMSRAYYGDKNTGHYGLALSYYTHFTSPIRRAPDLLIHYFLKQSQKEILNDKKYNAIVVELEKICNHLSRQERLANELEISVDKYLTVEYAKRFENRFLKGKIVQITQSKIMIETENHLIGYIPHNELNYYYFNELDFSVYDKRTKKTYCVDDIIMVKIKHIKKEKGMVIFSMQEEREKLKVKGG